MDRIYYKEVAPDYYVTVVDGVKIQLGEEYKFFTKDTLLKFEEIALEIPNRTIKVRFPDMAYRYDCGFAFYKDIPLFDIVKMDGTIHQMKGCRKSTNPHTNSVYDFLSALNLGFKFNIGNPPPYDKNKYRIWSVKESGVWCFYEPQKVFFMKHHIPTNIGKRLPFPEYPEDEVIIINKAKEPIIAFSDILYSDKVLRQYKSKTVYYGSKSYFAICIKDAIEYLLAEKTESSYIWFDVVRKLMIGICKYYIHTSEIAHIRKTDWKNLLIRTQKCYNQIDYDEEIELSNILINSVLTESKKHLKTKSYGKRRSKCEGITAHTSESEVA